MRSFFDISKFIDKADVNVVHGYRACSILQTTDEAHSYHVNILTCRIKAMRKLVTEHVTNGAITQRPEMKEHMIHIKSQVAIESRARLYQKRMTG